MDRAGWCAGASLPRSPGARIEPRWLRERRHERAALDPGLAGTTNEQIAIVGDLAAHALLGREPRQIALGDLAEPFLVPGIERDHEMAREALDQPARAGVVE